MKKLILIIMTLILLLSISATVLAADVVPPVPNQPQATPVQPPLAPEADQKDSNTPVASDKAIIETTRNITTLSENVVVKENERVYGNITTATGNVEVAGEVYGNITAGTGDIILKNSAKVIGNITVGTGELKRDPQAKVIGNVVEGRIDNGINLDRNFNISRPSFAERSFQSFLQMLGVLAMIAIVISIFPQNLSKMLGAFNLEPGRVVLVGVLGWIALPFVIVLSVITIIGPILLGLAAFVSVIVGAGLVSLLLGEKLQELFNWQNDNKIFTALLGLFVLWLGFLLPIASFFIVATCAIIGLGVVLMTKFGTGRPWFPARSAVVRTTNDEPIGNFELPKGGNNNEPPQS